MKSTRSRKTKKDDELWQSLSFIWIKLFEERLSMEFSSVPAESLLLEPFRYLERSAGKNLRVKLMDAFNAWLEVPDDVLTKIKDVVQMLHNASLLVDDIEDGSKQRRGAPVAHAIYGIPLTLNTANYVYFIALQEIHALKSQEAVSAFVGMHACTTHAIDITCTRLLNEWV
jgi:geranylgeranyl pyrophosphate synthase